MNLNGVCLHCMDMIYIYIFVNSVFYKSYMFSPLPLYEDCSNERRSRRRWLHGSEHDTRLGGHELCNRTDDLEQTGTASASTPQWDYFYSVYTFVQNNPQTGFIWTALIY
jgi:hypothetical protein